MKKHTPAPVPVIATSPPPSSGAGSLTTHLEALPKLDCPQIVTSPSLSAASIASSADTNTPPTSMGSTVTYHQERASRMQIQFSDAICRNMNIPEGYAQVAVLIIQWADDLDTLHTRQEVDQLEALFRDEFHYDIETITLNKFKTRHQFGRQFSGFLEKYDHDNNLLIVYYTGHGTWNKAEDELEFWSCNTGSSAPFVRWKSAETKILEEVSADTLAILDTCFAGNIIKGGSHVGRLYQVLAACGYGRDTEGPGERSFTAALILTLRERLKEGRPFTVWELTHEINKKEYRRGNPAQFCDRLGNFNQHISLSALGRDEKQRVNTERSIMKHNGNSDLSLRFSLDDRDLSQPDIEELTKRLLAMFKDIKLKLRRITFDGFEERQPKMVGPAMTMYWGQKWLRIIRRKSEAAFLQQNAMKPNVGFDKTPGSEWFSPTPLDAEFLERSPGQRRLSTPRLTDSMGNGHIRTERLNDCPNSCGQPVDSQQLSPTLLRETGVSLMADPSEQRMGDQTTVAGRINKPRKPSPSLDHASSSLAEISPRKPEGLQPKTGIFSHGKQELIFVAFGALTLVNFIAVIGLCSLSRKG